MFTYILKRIFAALPVLIGVNVITFALFFMVNTPEDMARAHLGSKHITDQAVYNWLKYHGYDKPLFYNPIEAGTAQFTQTLFWQKSVKLFFFDFGRSDGGRRISRDIWQRAGPSLMIALPILILGLCVNITFAIGMTLFKNSYVDVGGVVLCIIMMSISSLFYVIGGQYLIGKFLRLVPISGYDGGLSAFKFVILPIMVGVVSGIGAGSRWYRTLLLEENHKDYARTARAKGLSNLRVLATHVLRNALIPILTGVVVIIPTLFMGSLILESFFGIPGLGSYTIDAIGQQDFAIVRAMVFLGAVLYIVGLILTDISYTLVDPRVRLG